MGIYDMILWNVAIEKNKINRNNTIYALVKSDFSYRCDGIIGERKYAVRKSMVRMLKYTFFQSHIFPWFLFLRFKSNKSSSPYTYSCFPRELYTVIYIHRASTSWQPEMYKEESWRMLRSDKPQCFFFRVLYNINFVELIRNSRRQFCE
jgi:hypothetical protein